MWLWCYSSSTVWATGGVGDPWSAVNATGSKGEASKTFPKSKKRNSDMARGGTLVTQLPPPAFSSQGSQAATPTGWILTPLQTSSLASVQELNLCTGTSDLHHTPSCPCSVWVMLLSWAPYPGGNLLSMPDCSAKTAGRLLRLESWVAMPLASYLERVGPLWLKHSTANPGMHQSGTNSISQLSSPRWALQQLHCCSGEIAVARPPGDGPSWAMEKIPGCWKLCKWWGQRWGLPWHTHCRRPTFPGTEMKVWIFKKWCVFILFCLFGAKICSLFLIFSHITQV